MRLHHLSVTAFGPFVETAEVDFDTLSEAGLFLLSGPTGAGKSSVLDAVCFALYGAVPGDRQAAGRLRSDQAPPALAPSVTLEVGLAGRRFRIVRSPAWDRPKKRGTGMTREQARVTVTERVGDGSWVPLSSRLDEAGDLLGGLLGMNLEQFCQVVLLPQGQFQAFLRADSPARHQLLSRLFRTGRFERVEAWLRDHRLALRRDSDERAAIVGDLVSRLSEAAHRSVPEALADLTSSADGVALADWAREARDEAATRRTTASAEAEAAAASHEETTTAAQAARDLATARARVVSAAETIERLQEDDPRHLAEVERLERARRAAGVSPLSRLVAERDRSRAAAEERASTSLASATRGGLATDDLDAEQERVTDELASLSALLPAERQLHELRDQEAARVEQLERLHEADALAAAETETLAVLTHDLAARMADADRAAREVPVAESSAARLRGIVVSLHEAGRLRSELAVTVSDHAVARVLVVDLREQLLDLRERRIAGMAAELAGALVVGADCPVCGSSDHPRPARPATEQTDADAEREAQRRVDDAQAVELAHQLKVRELEVALRTAEEKAGDAEPAQTRLMLGEAERTLAELGARAATADALRLRLTEATQRASQVAQATGARRLEIAELTASVDHLRARTLELDVTLADARGAHPELQAAVAALTERRGLVREVRADATALETAIASQTEAVRALRRAAGEAGFATVDEALSAELDADDVHRLEQSIQEHRATLAASRRVLDDPGALELLTSPAPDVAEAEDAARTAAEALQRCRGAEESAVRTDTRVRRLTDELEAALADWAPLRAQLCLATRVSAFADGKASDNRLQMRLSAYVLAYRLSQVVAAANARLAQMSDRRYSLEHVGRRGAGERRGGLSLLVRDDWSGESRDPATLSGGETFVVSLALALGLADVVAHEAGGADLQTLFVDEGFGALDAETLDDVLDILDTLRENGRAVGVVSHVAEMRDRIPTQLVVGKARTGSSLRVVG